MDMADDDPFKIKAEFARRLRALMLDKGWNQSDLARAASQFLSKPMGRDNISIYLKTTSRTMPRPTHLRALERALGCDPSMLVTGAPTPGESIGSETEMRVLPGQPKRALLRINQEMPYSKALKILQILDESNGD